MSNIGVPSTGGLAPHLKPLGPQQGWFAVPTGVQRLYEYDLYSTGRIAAATNINGFPEVRLFGYAEGAAFPGGAAGTTASVSETNMQVGGIAPGNETYDVTAIAFEVFGDSNVAVLRGDLAAVLRVCVLRWNFGGTTIMNIAPVTMVGAGGGIFGATADTGTPITVLNNGNGGLWAYQNVVVAIPATQAFSLNVSFGSAGQLAAINTVNATQFRGHLFNQARVAIPIA